MSSLRIEAIELALDDFNWHQFNIKRALTKYYSASMWQFNRLAKILKSDKNGGSRSAEEILRAIKCLIFEVLITFGKTKALHLSSIRLFTKVNFKVINTIDRLKVQVVSVPTTNIVNSGSAEYCKSGRAILPKLELRGSIPITHIVV